MPFDSGTYQEALSVVHDVTHPAYGAVGDGVIDDGPAFRAAASAISSAGGGTIFVPATSSSYLIDSTPLIDLPSNSSIVGTGRASLLKRGPNYGSQILLRINGSSHVAVRDLACDFNNAGEFFRFVDTDGATPNHITISGNRIFDSNPDTTTPGDKWAVRLSADNTSSDVWVLYNHSSDDMQLFAGGAAVSNIWIVGNRCVDGRANGIGIKQRGDNQTQENIFILHNLVESVPSLGISAGGPDDNGIERTGNVLQNVIVANNTIITNDATDDPIGIDVRHQNITRNIRVEGNEIHEQSGGTNDGKAIWIYRKGALTPASIGENVYVGGNIVKGWANAFHSEFNTDVEVVGNIVQDSFRLMWSQNTDYVNIHGNTVINAMVLRVDTDAKRISVHGNSGRGLASSFSGYVSAVIGTGETLDGLYVVDNRFLDAGDTSVYGYNQDGAGTHSNVDIVQNTCDGLAGAVRIASGNQPRRRWLNSNDSAGIPEAEHTGTKTWNPGAVADGAVVSTTVSVGGAQVGDVVTVNHDSLGANDVLLTGHVESTGTVRVILFNKTGGSFDLTAGTLRAVTRRAT